MRTVFLGTPQAAVPSLKALVASSHPPVAVVCRPDRPVGRGRRMTAPPVKEAALELGLPVLQPESVKTAAFRAEIRAWNPDLLVVVAFGCLLGPKLMALAPHGAVNLHFSLLPRWRGAAPVQRAILAGDGDTGVSVFQLVQALDAGPVFSQESRPLAGDETAPALEEQLAEVGADLLVTTLEGIADGRLQALPQDESMVSLAPPLQKSEGDLEPTWTAEEISRRVRGLTPWPGARLEMGGKQVVLLDVAVLPESSTLDPGILLSPRGDELPMVCGEGSVLSLRSVKPEGKGAMKAASLIHGRLVAAGDSALPARAS